MPPRVLAVWAKTLRGQQGVLTTQSTEIEIFIFELVKSVIVTFVIISAVFIYFQLSF